MFSQDQIGNAQSCFDGSKFKSTMCMALDCETHVDLNAHSNIIAIPAGDTILADGAKASFVGTVLSGVVRVTKSLADGRDQVVSLLYAGDFFGQPTNEVTSFAYEAATDVKLCVLSAADFIDIIGRHRDLEAALLGWAMNEISRSQWRNIFLSSQNTLERVAAFLLDQMEHQTGAAGGAAGPVIVTCEITRRDMASYLWTTMETISRHLHHLADRKVITIIDSNHFQIINPQQLRRKAGGARPLHTP